MNDDSQTLLRAAQTGRYTLMRHLLRQGLNPNQVSSFSFRYNDGSRNVNGRTTQGLAAAYFAIAHGQVTTHPISIPFQLRSLNPSSCGVQEDVLDLLLEYRLDLDARRFVHTNPLEAAITGGSTSILTKCLCNGASIDVQNYHGKTALYVATDDNLPEMVDILLSRRANPDLQEGELKWAALHKAAFHGNAAIVTSLLKAKADVDLTTNDGDTPLHVAAWKGHAHVAKLLLEAGASRNITRKDNQTALFVATAYQNKEVTVVLIEAGCIINCKDSQGRTPLHNVGTNKDTQLANFLLDYGADIQSQNNKGDTPLHLSALKGNLRMFDLFLKRGADIWMRGWGGCTALHDAAAEGHIEIVRLILKTMPSQDQLNLKDDGEMSALGSAVTKDRIETVQLLCKYGCNSRLRYRGPVENCLLHWAAFNRSKKCLAFFLGARCLSVDTPNAHGTTALHVAAMKGYIDVMHILIQYGADVSATTGDGDNSLHLALIEGKGQIVKFLLERRLLPRVCLNQENMNGCTPLTIAAEKCDQESTLLLMNAGAHPYRGHRSRCSSLHYAAKHGNVSLAKALMRPLNATQRDNFIGQKTADGWTALHIAVSLKHCDFVKFLLERGANPNARGPDGSTPVHIAVRKDHSELLPLFQQRGVNLTTLLSDNDETIMHIAASAGALNTLKMMLVHCPAQLHKTTLSHGATPLISALVNDQEEAAIELIKSGSDLEVETSIFKDAPLDFSAKSGLLSVTRVILKRGVNIHHSGFLNRTALHWSAISGNPDLVLELLRQGIDPFQRDVFGYTAKDFAIQQRNDDAATVLTWWPSKYRPQQGSLLSNASEKDLPERFLCPISRSLMIDPVFASDGYAYDRSQITTWLVHNDTSPMTGNQLKNEDLVPALHLYKEMLQKQKELPLVHY